MSRIQLLAVGEIDFSFLGWVCPPIEAEFDARCEILEARLDAAPSLHPERQQYFSSNILDRMQKDHAPVSGRLLGVTSLDLYIPILTFVFGEAQLNGCCAVISTHRLQQEFYGLPPDPELLRERLIKEAVHELGHTAGLPHCDDYLCAMSASHAVEAIDLKNKKLCADCRARSLAALSRNSPRTR